MPCKPSLAFSPCHCHCQAAKSKADQEHDKELRWPLSMTRCALMTHSMLLTSLLLQALLLPARTVGQKTLTQQQHVDYEQPNALHSMS